MFISTLAQRWSHLIKVGTWQVLCIATATLAGCGGGAGGGEPSPAPAPVPLPVPAPAGPTDQERINAATQTANTNPACSSSAMPEGFYWKWPAL